MNVLFSHWVIWPALAILGASFGSFISLISYRIPLDKPWIAVRSRCPHCQTALTGRDLFPILSYLLAGRRCRHCHVRMSARYVAIELVMAFCFMGLYALKGPTPEFLILAGLSVCVMTMLVTDLEHYMIPDIVQAGIFLLGLAYVLVKQLPLDERLIGAAITFGIGLTLHYGYYWLKGRHGLGFGDVKLLASIGLWLPLVALPVYLFLSGLIGIATALLWRALGLGQHFPFGPALALTLLLMLLYPSAAGLFHAVIPQ